MLKLGLNGQDDRGYELLVLGAHADDLEIGCGGTLLRLIDAGLARRVSWIVFSAHDARAEEAQASAELFLERAGEKRIEVLDFRDGFFPYDGGRVKDRFEALKHEVAPDLIFTHRRRDLHQDHRLLSELTWNTFRNHLILEYEIPKYDGDLGQPNVYVELSEEICARKLEAIRDSFPSQAARHWFTEETFRSLMRLRGLEANSASGHAEGFHGHKLVV